MIQFYHAAGKDLIPVLLWTSIPISVLFGLFVDTSLRWRVSLCALLVFAILVPVLVIKEIGELSLLALLLGAFTAVMTFYIWLPVSIFGVLLVDWCARQLLNLKRRFSP